MNRDDELVRYTLTRPPTKSIGGRAPILIAEIGSSPAPGWWFERWCAAAKRAGATHIKAQMFKAEHFPSGEQAAKRPLEFPRERLPEFVRVAHENGLQAGVSVFDAEAVDLAARHCDFLKRAARERTNRELMGHINNALDENRIGYYYSVTSWGLDLVWPNPPAIPLFAIQRYATPMWYAMFRVLQAPHIMRCVNHWGWSSHTTGILDCLLAAKLGASVIEKHLRLSPDDIEAGWSLSVAEFRRMAWRIGTWNPNEH